MCGIGTITLDKTAPASLRLDDAVSAMLKDLDSRGGDATGLLTVSAGGRIDVQKAVCDAREFNEFRTAVAPGTRAIAMHTRLATQGPASFNRNNHPVMHGHAYVVHNGIIWDDHLLRTLGQPEVDTFALAVAADAVAKRRTGETPQAHAERIALALGAEEGSAAVGVAFRSQAFLVTARLHYSPLYFAEARGVRIAASSSWAVSEGFGALEIELEGREVTKSNGKTGRKAKSWKEWEEDIKQVREGGVLTWDAGMHSQGAIEMPKRAAATRLPVTYGGLWGESEGYGSLDSIADRVLDAYTGTERAPEIEWSRCDICDGYQWDTHLLDRWEMRICAQCEAAFVASGATTDSEVQA